jgi:hypothetical protein
LTNCGLCHQSEGTNKVFHNDYDYHFCDECYQSYYWTCPECQRSFWIGFNTGLLKSRHHGPRHYIELDELDHRWRRKRRECEGWKSEGRKAADRYFGFNKTLYPKRRGPVIHDVTDLTRYPKYR